MSNESRQAVFDAAQAFTQDASDDNFAALQQAVEGHKTDDDAQSATAPEQQAAPAATPETPPS